VLVPVLAPEASQMPEAALIVSSGRRVEILDWCVLQGQGPGLVNVLWVHDKAVDRSPSLPLALKVTSHAPWPLSLDPKPNRQV
jgi:hypothetical protein